MTSPSWQTAHYPATTTCGFCGATLTITLDVNGTTTVTRGHRPDCVQNPARNLPPNRQEATR